MLVTRSTALAPTNASATPTYRIYDGTSLLLTGSATGALQTGTVTGATNTSPIVITSASHGLQTGNRVTISGVGGNTAANSTYTITQVDGDTFSLDGSTGNGAYSSPGTWTLSGCYAFSITCSTGNGFASGKTYSMLTSFTVSTAMCDLDTFTVV